jgi:DNA-binding CsgD family transcriptional regulator
MNNSNGNWWLRGILSASSLAGLRESITMIVQRIGFQYFDFRGRYPQLPNDRNEIRLDNFPAGLLDAGSGNETDAVPDPMHHRAMQQATPLLWREWTSHYPDFFSEARKCGLMTGATHPVHGPVGDRSSISFIKGVGGILAEREILAALSECQLISCYVHRAAARISENRFDSLNSGARATVSAPTLTERERECLTWVATGKTAAQVAATLSLSEATIIYHLSKARRKLDAANSRHAISKAISLKLIAPN